MRFAAILALGLLLLAQEDRKKFDELLRQLDDENIEQREAAAKAMASLPAAADEWLTQEIKKSSGERQSRLKTIQQERRLTAELGSFTKLGIREAWLRAHPDFPRRIAEDDPAKRLAFLEELSGISIRDEEDLEDPTISTVRVPATRPELAAICALALQKKASKRLKLEVIAITCIDEHPAFLEPLRLLLLDEEPKVRAWSLGLLNRLDCDLTPVAGEILKLLEEADSDTVERISDLAREIDWGLHLDRIEVLLPKLGEATRSPVIFMVVSGLGGMAEPRMRALIAKRS